MFERPKHTILTEVSKEKFAIVAPACVFLSAGGALVDPTLLIFSLIFGVAMVGWLVQRIVYRKLKKLDSSHRWYRFDLNDSDKRIFILAGIGICIPLGTYYLLPFVRDGL